MGKPSPEEQLQEIRKDSNLPSRPTLTKSEWVEIYYALETKVKAIERGDYGSPAVALKKWRADLESILDKIGPDGRNMYR